jgi:phage minor structural protein
MTKLPRLWPSGEALHPVALSIEMNLAPLSTAQMTLPPEESAAVGQWIELFTPHGSAGIFRVARVSMDGMGTTQVDLEHGLCSLGDNLLPIKDSKRGSARELLTELLAGQNLWALGDVAVPDDVLLTWEFDYSNVLRGVSTLLKELPEYAAALDQTVTPWVLHIVALTDEDACECRLTRNLTSLQIETDRSDLCTRLHVLGAKNNTVLEADTIGTWGVVERTLTADPDMTEEDLMESAQRHLEKYKNPALTVQIGALELAEVTGDPFDKFTLGRVCRVALPEMQQTVRQRVVQIRYDDPLGRPEEVRISLASAQNSIADTVAGLVVDTTVLRKGNSDQKNMLLAAEENILLLSANITSIAESLSFYARKDGVISAINLSPETITISAEKINLEGLVTADMINAAIASAGGLYADRFTAKRADVTTLYADNFFFSNQALGLYDAIQVCTQSATYYSDTAYISYLDWDGNKKTLEVATGITQAQAPSYRTISYLGYK